MAHKLLLADDSVTIQRVIELTFADEDIDVSAVGDGEQAIERIRADRPDIVLADVGMPGRDGFEVAAFVKQNPELRHIPVVLLTGAFEPVDESRVRSVGCDGVLAKPFEPQLLIAKVKQLLAAASAGPAKPAPEPASAAQGDGAAFDEIPVQIPSTADFGTEQDLTAESEPESKVSLDEYFDRLDQAFASRGMGTDLPAQPSHEIWPPAPEAAPEWPKPPAIAGGPGPAMEPPPPPAATRQSSTAPAPDLAAAFALLLAAEQGDAVPAGALPLPAGAHTAAFDAVVDEVTRRVIERLADGAVRSEVADVVSQVAERLVRAEIDRLKRLA